MKIDDGLYREMKEAFQKIVDVYGKQQMLDYAKTLKGNGFPWAMWHMVQFDWTQTDDHPSFLAGRRRINPHRDQMWTIYKDGIHDAHIETALKKICKELDLPYDQSNTKVYPRNA